MFSFKHIILSHAASNIPVFGSRLTALCEQENTLCDVCTLQSQSAGGSVESELAHILDERELNVLYFCLMKVIVSGALSQFNFG